MLDLVPGLVGRHDKGEVAVSVLQHVVEMILISKGKHGPGIGASKSRSQSLFNKTGPRLIRSESP